jgi:hypothetical protein
VRRDATHPRKFFFDNTLFPRQQSIGTPFSGSKTLNTARTRVNYIFIMSDAPFEFFIPPEAPPAANLCK